jgi:transcriptional regulator with XRE-family HTH domain
MHLRSLRGVMEMSQEELANAANIPISQIGRIERVEVNLTLSTLDALADALEIRLNELLIF